MPIPISEFNLLALYGMNLARVYELLVTTDQQKHGFLKIVNSGAELDVRDMASAGLVEATLNDGKAGSFTAINRITAKGYTYMRTFEGNLLSLKRARERESTE